MNPALDLVYRTDTFETGSTQLDVAFEVVPAGKALNVARVVQTLGEEVALLGLMPRDSLDMYTRFCCEKKIKSHFMPVDGSLRINTTIVEQKSGQVSHLNSKGLVIPARVQDEFALFLKKFMHAGDIWAFSGSLPNGFDDDFYRKLIRQCRKSEIRTSLDTRDKAFKNGVVGKPDFVKPNLDELERYFGEPIKGVRHMVLRGKRLLDKGIPAVFISLGSDGLIAIHENDCLLCSAPQVKAVDTVGCGDALMAGLLVGHARKFSFSEMCRMAVACGTSKALHHGPGVISKDEVWQLMEEVKIEVV